MKKTETEKVETPVVAIEPPFFELSRSRRGLEVLTISAMPIPWIGCVVCIHTTLGGSTLAMNSVFVAGVEIAKNDEGYYLTRV